MEEEQKSGVKQLIIKFYMEDSRDRSCYNKLKKQKNMSAFIKNLVLSGPDVESNSDKEMEQRLGLKIEWAVSRIIQELQKTDEEDDWKNIKM